MIALYATALTVAIAGLALLLHPVGPFGFFWRPDAICPSPTLIQTPFFAVIAGTEAIACGLGFSFLAFCYRYVRAVLRRRYAIMVWISISWFLINWYPHNALHMNAGLDLWRTIVIDFSFHITLIIAACSIAYAFIAHLSKLQHTGFPPWPRYHRALTLITSTTF